MARSVVDLAGERLGLAGVGGWLLGPFAGVCGGARVLARDVSWCRRGRFCCASDGPWGELGACTWVHLRTGSVGVCASPIRGWWAAGDETQMV